MKKISAFYFWFINWIESSPNRIFILIIAGAFLAVVPKFYQERVNSYTCDLGFNVEHFFKSFVNVSHLSGYFLLGTALLVSIKKHKIVLSLGLILCISVSMEALQILSWSRRCSLTDMTPNFIGFAIAIYTLSKIYPRGLFEDKK